MRWQYSRGNKGQHLSQASVGHLSHGRVIPIIGAGTVHDDVLFKFPITGHDRYLR